MKETDVITTPKSNKIEGSVQHYIAGNTCTIVGRVSALSFVDQWEVIISNIPPSRVGALYFLGINNTLLQVTANGQIVAGASIPAGRVMHFAITYLI